MNTTDDLKSNEEEEWKASFEEIMKSTHSNLDESSTVSSSVSRSNSSLSAPNMQSPIPSTAVTPAFDPQPKIENSVGSMPHQSNLPSPSLVRHPSSSSFSSSSSSKFKRTTPSVYSTAVPPSSRKISSSSAQNRRHHLSSATPGKRSNETDEDETGKNCNYLDDIDDNSNEYEAEEEYGSSSSSSLTKRPSSSSYVLRKANLPPAAASSSASSASSNRKNPDNSNDRKKSPVTSSPMRRSSSSSSNQINFEYDRPMSQIFSNQPQQQQQQQQQAMSAAFQPAFSGLRASLAPSAAFSGANPSLAASTPSAAAFLLDDPLAVEFAHMRGAIISLRNEIGRLKEDVKFELESRTGHSNQLSRKVKDSIMIELGAMEAKLRSELKSVNTGYALKIEG